MSASLAMQRLLVAALTGVPGVTGVFDAPAPDAVPPYLTIGPDLVTDWSHKTARGHEHRVTVTLWHPGPGVAAAKALLGPVEDRLLAMTGESLGHRLVSVLLLRNLVLSAADGWTQGIIEARLRSAVV